MAMKQVIVARTDIRMSRGKLAAQAAHASVSCVIKSDNKTLRKWETEGQKKVILRARTLEDLMQLKEKCRKSGIVNAMISDAGHTELTAGTITALGIGPDEERRIDKVTGSLPLLK